MTEIVTKKPLVMPEKLNDVKELQNFLATNYMKQIKNFFSDEKQALKFLSSVMADVQRNPKLMESTPQSLINSYIQMAQLGFMPSGVSGEAYVLPYNNSKKNGDGWIVVKEAQLQIGYKGLVTLFYKAGVEKITAGIVRKNDKTTFINGEISHEVDMSLSASERGEAIGAYVTVKFKGESSTKYMNGKDIIAHAQKYSKSYDPNGKNSPWNPINDMEKWMWMKTVLIQHSKLLPKNETINQAIAIDYQDSRISNVKEKLDMGELKMGAYLDKPKPKNETNKTTGGEDAEKTIQLEDKEDTGEDTKGFTDSLQGGK
jgi:recombination protein RecT